MKHTVHVLYRFIQLVCLLSITVANADALTEITQKKKHQSHLEKHKQTSKNTPLEQ